MSLQIQDGHWYERRDGKVVQAKFIGHRSVIHQFDADGNDINEPVFPATGSANYEFGKCGTQKSDRDLIREVQPPTKLTLRVGGKYRRRDGEVVTIEREQRAYTDGQLVYAAGPRWYLPNGTTYYEEYRETQNIVAEVLPEPPAKLSLKVGDRCLTRGGKEVVLYATEHSNKNSDTHPLAYSIIPGDQYTVRADGQWSLDGSKDGYDIVSVLPPLDPSPFRITAGEYYTTRDGRCAYVASGPVKLPREAEYDTYFGYVDDPDEDDTIEVVAWYDDGRMEQDNETDFDLVAPWSPPPYVCPHTGKTYNLVEAQ